MTLPASSEVEDRTGDLIGALSLLTYSAWHRDWSPRQVLNWVIAPIMLGQYLVLREGGKVVGFATWAFVDDNAQQALRTSSRPLTLAEWRGGPHVWVVDFVAPFGHVRVLARLLRKLFVAAGMEGHVAHRMRRYAPAP